MKPTVFGVGIYQSGDYSSKIAGKATREYRRWKSMLQRCYSQDFADKNPAYETCTVSDDFLNFQYFADWCNDQPGFHIDGWQLDKDILHKNNQIYCKERCIFVPQEINKLFTKRSILRGKFPVGVSWYPRYEKYRATITSGSKPRHLGYFEGMGEAFCAYKAEKEAVIKNLALFYKEQLDPRTYEALINYKVEITD